MPQARRKAAVESNTVFESLRARSNLDKLTGYSPFFHAWIADLPRLCSGASCWALVMTCLMESLGRPRDKGEPMPEWTGDLDKSWLATVCRTDRRTVDRDLKYLESSGIAQVRHTIQKTVAVRLCFRDWPGLPDYKPPDRPEPSGEPVAPKQTVELVKKPRRVKAGEYSEPVKVACAVSSFRFRAGGSVDMEFTAVVKEGEFVVQTCEVLAQGETKAKHSNVSNNLIPKSRHSRLKPEPVNSEQKAKDEAKAKHPRAEELARLFDPLLLRFCQRSLSADPVVFAEVLNAVGDVPHDFLVKFVVQRAKRPISSPKVCLSIVRDVAQSWHEITFCDEIISLQEDRLQWGPMTREQMVANLRYYLDHQPERSTIHEWAHRELQHIDGSERIARIPRVGGR